ncbi:MAG: S-adenosylmethionine:tRNA ribosyltransferase-isomerase [Cyclobacteriaceae bacterium]
MQRFINMQDYTYDLPDDRIAYQPLANRDESKLLVYRGGKIEHRIFKNLADFIPESSLLVFNDTKVIPARLHFQKESGADIEVFLLNPVSPDSLLTVAMLAKNKCAWRCTIGNLKRWKDAQVLTKHVGGIILTASLANRSEGVVEFSWPGSQTFSEVITTAGSTPLPPYIKRAAQTEDALRYQTIYSNHEGAVAAPTAGLHFTDEVFKSLSKKSIDRDFLTLHVSAGTFQPVKAENALDHVMHHEQVTVTRQTIENLRGHQQKIIAVGTTSMRTLESLYWFGVKLTVNSAAEFAISQNDPYQLPGSVNPDVALDTILRYMDANGLTHITGTTSIFIYPGYRFRLCTGLITNFHQPASTLILLVAAFIGPVWKEVYAGALNGGYRFLSYGDSSLLLP